MSDIFGTDPKKLARAGDPSTSKEAAASINSTRMEREVLIVISKFPNGCISDQVRHHANMRGKSYSTVTARYRALLDKRLIERTGERRKGLSKRAQSVMRITQKGKDLLTP